MLAPPRKSKHNYHTRGTGQPVLCPDLFAANVTPYCTELYDLAAPIASDLCHHFVTAVLAAHPCYSPSPRKAPIQWES